MKGRRNEQPQQAGKFTIQFCEVERLPCGTKVPISHFRHLRKNGKVLQFKNQKAATNYMDGQRLQDSHGPENVKVVPL